jgi:hypothetical protein
MIRKLGKRKCNWCKNEFQKTRAIQPACSFDCLIKLSKEKVKKDRAKIEKEETKVLKVGLLTHKDWLGMLQVKINFIARTIDTDFSCISSRRTKGQMHAGHFFTVGAHPNLRFHLFNIWKQTSRDNTYNGGNITEYLFNLHRLFGNDFVNNEILNLDEKYPVTKLSVPEIKEAIEKCKEVINRQKKGEFIAKTTQERITIRIELNQLIGIYK